MSRDKEARSLRSTASFLEYQARVELRMKLALDAVGLLGEEDAEA